MLYRYIENVIKTSLNTLDGAKANIIDVQESNDPLDGLANIRGLRADQFSSFANVTLQ